MPRDKLQWLTGHAGPDRRQVQITLKLEYYLKGKDNLEVKGALNLKVWDDYNLEVEGEGDYARLRTTSRARVILISPLTSRSTDRT